MQPIEQLVNYHKKGSRLTKKLMLLSGVAAVGIGVAGTEEARASKVIPKLPTKFILERTVTQVRPASSAQCAWLAQGLSVSVRPNKKKSDTMNYNVSMSALPEACDKWGASRVDVVYLRDSQVHGKRKLAPIDSQVFNASESKRSVSIHAPTCLPGSQRRRDAVVAEAHFVAADPHANQSIDTLFTPELFEEGITDLPKGALGSVAVAAC